MARCRYVGANDQQPSQRSFAHSGRGTETLLAAGGVLPGSEADPRRKISAAAEHLGRRRQGGQCRCDQRADARDRHQAPCGLVLTGATRDFGIQLCDLFLELKEHAHQNGQTSPHCWKSAALRFDQCGETAGVHSPLRNDFAKLGHVSSQGIDCLRSLPDQQLAHPKHDSSALVLLALQRDKPHRRTLCCFTDGFSIRHVVLLALHERLYISRRDQSHLMAQPGKFPAPEVRA